MISLTYDWIVSPGPLAAKRYGPITKSFLINIDQIITIKEVNNKVVVTIKNDNYTSDVCCLYADPNDPWILQQLQKMQ